MKDIKSCLEKQIAVSKELNHILTTLDDIEEKERELLYEENKKLLNSLNDYNQENVKLTNDRVLALQNRVNDLLRNENTNKDPNFKEYLLKFNKELESLQYKIKYLDDNLTNMSEKHNAFIQNRPYVNNQVNTNKPINTNRPINTSKPVNTKPTIKKEQKFEFNFGANMLNIVGVLLILIAFITFGSYVYTNYLNETLKGLFLFIVAGATMLVGDKVLSKKIHKFGFGITTLGFSGLLASLMINYIHLGTITNTITSILCFALLGFGIYYSKEKNSNILRMITIIFAYNCACVLFETNVVNQMVSLAILLTVLGLNTFIPINRKNFVMYSTILIGFCSNIFEFTGLMLVVFLGLALICINFMNIISTEDKDKNRLVLFLISLYFLVSTGIECGKEVLIIYLIIAIVSYVLCNNGLKNIFVINAVVVMLLFINKYTNDIMYDVLLILTILATAFVTIKEKDICLKITLIFISIIGMWEIVSCRELLETIFYVITFSLIIFKLSMENKDSKLPITLKHLVFMSILIALDIEINNFSNFIYYINHIIIAIVSVGYVMLLNKVEILKDKYIENTNKIILILAFLVSISNGYDNTLAVLIMLIVCALILALFTNVKYVNSEVIQQHKVLMYVLFATYGILKLFNSIDVGLDLINVLISISLMTLAFISVLIGLKLDILEVRKYGLILSFIVCAKLIFVDFYSVNFAIKTILFLVVGIVALVISYVYSKLEQELKNKKNK